MRRITESVTALPEYDETRASPRRRGVCNKMGPMSLINPPENEVQGSTHLSVVPKDAALPACERFVTAIVADVLGRTPDTNELADGVDQLMTGVGRRALATALIQCDEARQRTIDAFYRRCLGRAPSEDGMAMFLDWLNAGKSEEEVLAVIASSSEYAAKSGGGHAGFVHSLFQDVLGRQASDAEANCWIALLNSFSATRLCVARIFVEGDEFREAKVRSWFHRYLTREPDTDTLEHWLFQIRHGMSPESVQASLLASPEYLKRAIGR